MNNRRGPATALLLSVAFLLAACQGAGDRPTSAGKSVTQGSGYSHNCNGPCFGYHRRRAGMGPH
jgi:predicted small secreted protein